MVDALCEDAVNPVAFFPEVVIDPGAALAVDLVVGCNSGAALVVDPVVGCNPGAVVDPGWLSGAVVVTAVADPLSGLTDPGRVWVEGTTAGCCAAGNPLDGLDALLPDAVAASAEGVAPAMGLLSVAGVGAGYSALSSLSGLEVEF